MVRYLEQKTRDRHFLHVKDNLKIRLWRCCSQGQFQGQGKMNRGDYVQLTTQGQCSRGGIAIHKKDENPKEKARVRDRRATKSIRKGETADMRRSKIRVIVQRKCL